MKPKHQRMIFIGFSVAVIAVAVTFVLQKFEDNLLFFYSPSDILALEINSNKKIRVGGMVKEGSVIKDGDSLTFKVTDYNNDLIIKHQGEVPALFREGQGVVAEGNIESDGSFRSSRILAKHDENYMPPEVKKSLKKQQDKY